MPTDTILQVNSRAMLLSGVCPLEITSHKLFLFLFICSNPNLLITLNHYIIGQLLTKRNNMNYPF